MNLPRAVSFLLALAPLAAAGTLHVPGDFESLQAAVDAAAPGDQIVLHKGTWPGPITVSGKSDLVIRGAGKPVIDATGVPAGLTLDGCSGIELRGLRVENFNTAPGNEANIRVLASDHVEVHHCDVRGALAAGIDVSLSQDVSVHHNQVFGMDGGGWPESGVRVGESDHVTVERNHVSFVISGVRFFPASNDSIVSRNTIHDLWHAGVEVVGNDNLVERNSVRDSSDDGIWCSGDDSIITRNTVRDVTFGITIFDGSENRVERNTVTHAGAGGIWTKAESDGSDLLRNKISASGESLGGLRLEGEGGTSQDDRVLKSKGAGLVLMASNNQVTGLRLVKPADGGVDLAGTGNTLTDTRVTHAGTDGFAVDGDENSLLECRATGSLDNGFQVTGTLNVFNTCKAKGSGNLDKNEAELVDNTFIDCDFGTESP